MIERLEDIDNNDTSRSYEEMNTSARKWTYVTAESMIFTKIVLLWFTVKQCHIDEMPFSEIAWAEYEKRKGIFLTGS